MSRERGLMGVSGLVKLIRVAVESLTVARAFEPRANAPGSAS